MESSSRGPPPNQLPRDSECKANASELSRVIAVSARDMKTTGLAAPHNTPPNRQWAVYMIAFTARFAESKLGKSMTSATPKSKSSRVPMCCLPAGPSRGRLGQRCQNLERENGARTCDAGRSFRRRQQHRLQPRWPDAGLLKPRQRIWDLALACGSDKIDKTWPMLPR